MKMFGVKNVLQKKDPLQPFRCIAVGKEQPKFIAIAKAGNGSLSARYPCKMGKMAAATVFLTATNTQKTHVDSAIKKILALAQ